MSLSHKKQANQITGNIGMYYVAYELSRLGWNVLPTSRNAYGVDIVIYDQSAQKTSTIQVKSLSKRNAVPIGSSLTNLIAKYLVVVRDVQQANPTVYVAEIDDKLKASITPNFTRDGQHKKVYWLEYKVYEQFSKSLEEVIGQGSQIDETEL